ncbi:unnamed protein product, partial [Adineta steineri]
KQTSREIEDETTRKASSEGSDGQQSEIVGSHDRSQEPSKKLLTITNSLLVNGVNKKIDFNEPLEDTKRKIGRDQVVENLKTS